MCLRCNSATNRNSWASWPKFFFSIHEQKKTLEERWRARFFFPSVCREDPEERWRVLGFFSLLFAEEDRVDYSLFFGIEFVS
jgi:hypothetical protein